MMAVSLAYAQSMQDDEAYQNATPDQKYGNWFVRIPGVKEPLKLPIPFEIGYLFKALPEALYNTVVTKHGKEEAAEAFKGILRQLIPGGSSYGIPQVMKPAIEAALGKSLYTGRDILSAQEKDLLPEAQYRENTSELAKMLGKAGISPIMAEQLIGGYTGGLGVALMQILGLPFVPDEGPQKAVKRLSDMPVVGSAFQPNDAGWIANNTFELLKEGRQIQKTFNDYIERGEVAKAKELVQDKAIAFAQAELDGYLRKELGNIKAAETAIQASNLSPEDKRARLDEMRQMRIKVASLVRDAYDKTARQEMRP